MLEKYRQAGKIAAECLEYGYDLIKVGVSVKEVLDKIENKIQEKGAGMAFPAQISLNSVAAHQCSGFDDSTIFKEGDIVKLDIGTHVEGFIGDTAVTKDLGNNPELVKASREALNNALKVIAPGLEIAEIGKVIEETIQSFGFNPIRNLSGHGLCEYDVHTKPTIPNYNNNDKNTLKKGMFIAIEPFATTGDGLIHEKGQASVFQQVQKKQVRNPIARVVLQEINNYKMLPFAQRWLAKKHGVNKTNYALNVLVKEGILRAYPPLVEIKGGLVSQAEHSVYIDEKPVVLTKSGF